MVISRSEMEHCQAAMMEQFNWFCVHCRNWLLSVPMAPSVFDQLHNLSRDWSSGRCCPRMIDRQIRISQRDVLIQFEERLVNATHCTSLTRTSSLVKSDKPVLIVDHKLLISLNWWKAVLPIVIRDRVVDNEPYLCHSPSTVVQDRAREIFTLRGGHWMWMWAIPYKRAASANFVGHRKNKSTAFYELFGSLRQRQNRDLVGLIASR